MGTGATDGGSLDEPSAGIDAYVPRVFATWLREDPATRWKQVDATLVFVDVSGFTALSERLARAGNIGAEELTDTISTCFAALLGVAYAGGGSLLKFGGDALLLLFAGDDHVERGARSAVGMRTALRELGKIQTSAGSVTLKMSIGVHSGDLNVFVVGGSHREFMITGPGATQTVTMEGAAEAGQIIVSPATAARLDPGVIGAPCGPGFLLAAAPSIDDPGYTLADKGNDALLLQAVPVALREHLNSSLRDAEHRRVTIAFLKFKGLDERISDDGPAATADALDTMIRIAQEGADRHGITFLGTDVDAGGGKVLLIAGAPVSGGNDEERMLLALRDIVEQPSPIPFQIGVHTGHVFAGDIGPPYRRSYTVMGDAVNLAARVMSRSSAGEILATDEVLDAANTTFETTQLEPFMVKGKSEPVIASTVGLVVGARVTERQVALPFVGREAELTAFDEVLRTARDGAGRLVEVVGEVGMGKSRLLAEFQERAADLEVHELRCELHRASTPYGATRKLFRALAGIPVELGAKEAGQQLAALLRDELPELVEWAPLLAIAFGAELPPTATTESLDEQYLRPRLNDAVSEWLAWRWPGPALLTIEDVQWMDEASTDVLTSLAAQLDRRPWVVCLARRDRESDGEVADDEVTDGRLRLQLTPLDEQGMRTLAGAVTETAPLPEHELAVLIERSAGNPLFLQELIASAREEGGIEQLPDSIEALMTARIDRLPHRDLSVLRHVSVLGQRFPLTLAAAVVPEPSMIDGQIWDRLGDFLERDGGTVRFRHALTRDVAYGGMRYRLRRELHAKAGDVIAAATGGRPEDQAALLSFHFFHAQRHRESWQHSLTAADQARAVYANAEAATFLERAVEAARGIEGLLPMELARVHEQLGDVRDHMGVYAAAVTAYRAARRLLPSDPVDEARLMLKQARELGRLNNYSQARRWIRRGLKLLEAQDSPRAAKQHAQLSVDYAAFCQKEGRHRLAIRWCKQAIAEAEAADERDALARAYTILDWSYVNVGRLDEATHSARALEIYEQLGDLNGQMHAINHLAGLAYHQGRWADTRGLLLRTVEASQRIGFQEANGMAQYNLGLLLVEQGRLDEAAEPLGAALRVCLAAGDRAGVASAQRLLARSMARSGELAEALELGLAAKATFEELGAKTDTVDALVVVAECHLLAGDVTRSLPVIDDALALDAALGSQSNGNSFLYLLRGYALMRVGELAGAREAFEASLTAARSMEMDYDIALGLRALTELGELDDVPDAMRSTDGVPSELDVIVERLGIIKLPELAGGT